MEIPLDPSDNVIIRSTQETLEFMQVCQVPEKYLVNDVKPGDLIKIAFPDHISYLCKVFRNESNDCIVVSDVAIRRQDTGGHREGARFEKITCVPTEISKLTLDVFLYEDRIPIDLFEDQDVLVEVIRNLCMMVVLCDDFTIDLSAYQLLANNWGIARLENLHSDAGLGFVTSRTEITLNSIRFVNHALQSSITNPLSGLSLLRSSIESELRNKKGNSNLLLVGPSGCGKTSLIHSIADSLQANLFNFSPQISQLPGQNLLISRFERIIRLSRISSQQTLILIEDVEQFCPKKSRERRTTNPSSWELTHGLDMVREIEKITVIATTRNVEGVDSSLRRAGRLDREIFFKVPDEEQRREIVTGLFHEHLKEERETDSIIDLITSRTPAFVGGDLVELAKAATRLSRADYNNGINRPSIERALLTVRPVGALSNPFLVERDPKMTLNSLGGLETLKKNLEMSIFRPLAHADAFLRFGLTLPKGILMYGPPGCAKTTVAKCLATEMNRHLIAVSAAQIYSPYVGDSEQLLAQIFHQARICAPSIIFIDEIGENSQRNEIYLLKPLFNFRLDRRFPGHGPEATQRRADEAALDAAHRNGRRRPGTVLVPQSTESHFNHWRHESSGHVRRRSDASWSV